MAVEKEAIGEMTINISLSGPIVLLDFDCGGIVASFTRDEIIPINLYVANLVHKYLKEQGYMIDIPIPQKREEIL